MAKELWGGRFKKGIDPIIKKFSSSIYYDKRLAEYDIKGSVAHAKMLSKCGIISKKDSQKIVKGLEKISKKLKNGKLYINDAAYEDIHMAVTDLLAKEVGEGAAHKLHTARSRNDQVALDVRMYCRDQIAELCGFLSSLQKCLLKGAKKFSAKKLTVASYTHLQKAQCIMFSHQLLSYMEMFQRDKERLNDAHKRVDVMPLGSAAHRGSSLPIDRHYAARLLGFSKVSDNSIDAVSDRDFVIEIISALAIIAMHLSRITEDFIIWSTQEFNYVQGDDSHYTGSSMMPNKKNPDPLELIRGYSSGVYGQLMSVLVMMKGLPMTYNRDMQLDKPALFEATDTIKICLGILEEVLYGIKVNEAVMRKSSENEYIFAADICEYLAQKKLTWWDAHRISGEIVSYSLETGTPMSGLSDGELKAFSKHLNREIMKKLLDPSASVKRVRSFGGTDPTSVKRQIRKWERILKGKGQKNA
jgi:argininosuccinate lyase